MGTIECITKCMNEQIAEVLQPQQQACNDHAREGAVAIINDYVDSVNAARDTFSGSNLREAQAQHEYKRANDRLIAFQGDLRSDPQCHGVTIPDVLTNASALLFHKMRGAEEKEALPNEDISDSVMLVNNRWMGVNKLAHGIRYRPTGDGGFIPVMGSMFTIPSATVGFAGAAGATAAAKILAGIVGAAKGALLFGGLLAVAEGIVYTAKVNTDIHRVSVKEF